MVSAVTKFGIALAIGFVAVYIRLRAVVTYGRVIHEFDPWFNFRATQYLVDHGYEKFSTWYDTMSWSPLGRPVGTTIYPGMMVTASTIYHQLQAFGMDVSLNDVCVFIPAAGGLLSTIFTGGLAYEVSGKSAVAALWAAGIMAIIPAHLMRSVAGGFDNESVAISAICGTFYFWVRSLRTDTSWPFAFFAALAYVYMAAAWGAYTFVLNMVGVHVAVLLLFGRFSHKLYKAYTLFYLLGTLGALQIPIVGWAPLQSLEQLGPLAVYVGMQGFLVLDTIRVRRKLTDAQYVDLQLRALVVGCAVVALVLPIVLQSDRIWSMSVRVRALFVKHTRTGNPLVDSVAEHRATSPSAFFTYFHFVMFFIPFGVSKCTFQPNDQKIFMALYTTIAGYFATKMIRLILILAPAAAVCAGIVIESAIAWLGPIGVKTLKYINDMETDEERIKREQRETEQKETEQKELEQETSSKKKKPGKPSASDTRSGASLTKEANAQKNKETKARTEQEKKEPTAFGWLHDALIVDDDTERQFGFFLFAMLLMCGYQFIDHSFKMSHHLSEPQIMVRGQGPDGGQIILDDFREGYWYLRDNTPEDARVMAWWDYGYQITGIGNRTTLADGNTWNHEHIALLGRCLVSPEDEAHAMVKHLADYVLVWSTRYAGRFGDDVAKMPHMARIAGSIYPNIKADEFYLNKDRSPSAEMRKSLLYQLHSYRFDSQVPKPKYFEEVFTTEHDMVRIYKVLDVDQESKNHPKGEYPPALAEILAEGQAFSQD